MFPEKILIVSDWRLAGSEQCVTEEERVFFPVFPSLDLPEPLPLSPLLFD